VKGGSLADQSTAHNGSELLPILEKASDHPCFECALCCKYIAIEIDTPTTNREYDYLVWYLYHPGVSAFVDWDGTWFIRFETRCRHLTSQGLCGIYERRPAICQEFDWKDCERHVTDSPPDKWLFESADQFLAWLAKQRPKSYQRFEAWNRKRARTRTSAELRRLKVAALAPRAAAR
jgi:Fe-S-cluster containining protein